MATVRIIDPNREMTLHFYRAPGEKNRPDDLRAGLHDLGLSPRELRENPATHDVWMLVLDITKNHGPAIGTGLVALLALWLKSTKNRRIEIERPGLRMKVATVRDLEKTLTALHNYDELNLTLNNAKPTKRPMNKKSVAKKIISK
jgi:hypothetical protein